MDNVKSRALAFGLLGIGIITVSFLLKMSNQLLFVIIGIGFLIGALMMYASLRFKFRWLLKAVEFTENIQAGHLAVFLQVYEFGLAFVQNNYLIPGIVMVYVAYIILARGIGLLLGKDVFRPLFKRLAREIAIESDWSRHH